MSALGWHTIHDDDDGPYMTWIWIGRLRLHVFHRGDADPDCHDHPWDFWTFPLTSYVEEVARPGIACAVQNSGLIVVGDAPVMTECVVRAFRLHFRPAEHTHRVLGRHFFTLDPDDIEWLPDPVHVTRPGRIVTIVWRGGARRKWGFLKNREGRWCWQPWRDYQQRGGKHAPCEPGRGAA